MRTSIKFMINRVREPSTWAAISILLVAFQVPAAIVPFLGHGLDFVANLLPAATAVAAIVLPEQPNYGNE